MKNIKIEIVPITKVKKNPKNPRTIKDESFERLVKSIREFPEMLNIRPTVVNDKWIILGGNRRYDACKAAGLKNIPIIRASDLTEEQQKRFIIADNVSSGEWDYDILRGPDWDQDQLFDWGVDVPVFEEAEEEGLNDSEPKDQFKIEVVFKNESQQNKAYNKFIEQGYECRLLD